MSPEEISSMSAPVSPVSSIILAAAATNLVDYKQTCCRLQLFQVWLFLLSWLMLLIQFSSPIIKLKKSQQKARLINIYVIILSFAVYHLVRSWGWRGNFDQKQFPKFTGIHDFQKIRSHSGQASGYHSGAPTKYGGMSPNFIFTLLRKSTCMAWDFTLLLLPKFI
jgi:hypothetical protein